MWPSASARDEAEAQFGLAARTPVCDTPAEVRRPHGTYVAALPAFGLEASAIPKIFISYRRGDSASASGRIYDRLVAAFGRGDVFKDVDNIPPGVYFGSYIQESLRQCAVALVIIGPRWLDAQSGGGRRLDDPQDWVRLEIETAFALGLRVIPLLVEGAHVPRATDLPDTLRNLARIQISAVRDDPDFTHDVERVIAAIQQPVAAPLISPSPLPSPPAPPGEFAAAAAPISPSPTSSWAPIADPVPSPSPAPITVLPPPAVPATGHPIAGSAALPAPPASKANRAPGRRRRILQLAAAGEAVVMVAVIVFTSLMYQEIISPWSVTSSPTSQNLFSVAMDSTSDGWAVGGGGSILHYSGGKWSAVTSPTNQDPYSVAMASASDGWAVGRAGTILHYNGVQWSTVTSPTNQDLYGVAMVSASDGWIGGGGTILHYTGGQWSTVANLANVDLSSVAMVSATEGWAVGDDNILHYTNGQWATVTSPTNKPLDSVAMDSASDGWAVGYLGTILHYTGGQWSAVASPTYQTLESISLVSASDGWIVGENGTILHYTSGA